ncbi:MAG TPA: phosphoribosylformylglycinamidine synthase, partial [Chryseobacterium indologenes]|nr:phosphoribosylformylglycinamidine synthase [Chryseobacterium indologenes]
MSKNKRIFVEKRGIFDVESPKIFDEVKAVVPGIQRVKVYNVYDIFNLNDGEFEKVVNNTFVDPVTDILHAENPAKNIHFAMEFLPGQYDQRADSAQQCIALLTENEKSKVRSGTLIEFEGVSEADLVKIKDLLINNVESQEKALSILDIPADEIPSKVIVHENFINFNDAELENFFNTHGFAL